MSEIAASPVRIVTASSQPLAPLAEAGDYVSLLKPRVMSLVIFTAFVGLIRSPVPMAPILAFAAMLALALGAGAAGALNMWFDHDIDRVMRRTQSRAVPSGRVPRAEALAFGLVIAAIAVMVMALAANPLAAGLLAFSIFFYAVVYTMWLKRRTPQNIVIGGAAGAFPPLIMQVAAVGHVTTLGVCLFLLIFLWTPAHFWALALYARGDYEAARVPMLPNAAGAAATRRAILGYAVLSAGFALAPAAIGAAGPLYAALASVLAVMFVAGAIAIARSRAGDLDAPAAHNRRARRFFAFSILFLFLLFAGLLAESAMHIRPFTPLWRGLSVAQAGGGVALVQDGAERGSDAVRAPGELAR